MSKRKPLSDTTEEPTYTTLDDDQLAALQLLPEHLHPNLKSLLPLFEQIRETFKDRVKPHQRALPTRPATFFKHTRAAAEALGVDYRDDSKSYDFELKETQIREPAQLSEHFGFVIQDIKTNAYVKTRQDESFCRTVLDLIMIDRLRELKDKDAFFRLQISAEVAISVQATDTYGNPERVKGRAHWALGYGHDKDNTGAILLVVEAKPYQAAAVGMPQLLVYMAGVQAARMKQNHTNTSVFGMLSDSRNFQFAFLDKDKKFFTTKFFIWHIEQSTILAYIDTMLKHAIESSPHTTPTKSANRILRKYSEYIEGEWSFGDGSHDEENEVTDSEDADDIVDVIKIDNRIVMRTKDRREIAD